MAVKTKSLKRPVGWHLPRTLIEQIDKEAMKASHHSGERIKPSHIVERLLTEGLNKPAKPKPELTN